MPTRTRVTFNGKFLTALPSGVHRVGYEMIEAVDALLGEMPGLRDAYQFEILCPPNILRRLDTSHIRLRIAGRLRSQFWEHVELPMLARDSLIVDLCNLGPAISRHAITMMHDAQVYITPGSYSWPFRTFYRTVMPILGRRHARILTVSGYSRDQLAKYGVAPRDKITVIHNGVDHVLRVAADAGIVARLGLTQHRYVVGLANTQVHKNVGLLLRAFAAPELADLRLVLIGGAGRTAFVDAGYRPPENVVFAGRVSDEEMRGLFEGALCLGFPSTTEGFGLPPLEAMIVGCPAVVAPCGALPEVCGDAAVYVAPDDVAAWSKELASLADTRARREALVTVSRAHAAQFTWRRAASALLDVITDVAATT